MVHLTQSILKEELALGKPLMRSDGLVVVGTTVPKFGFTLKDEYYLVKINIYKSAHDLNVVLLADVSTFKYKIFINDIGGTRFKMDQ